MNILGNGMVSEHRVITGERKMQWLGCQEMEILADSTIAYPRDPPFCSDIGQTAFDIKEHRSGQPTHHLPVWAFECHKAFGHSSRVAVMRMRNTNVSWMVKQKDRESLEF